MYFIVATLLNHIYSIKIGQSHNRIIRKKEIIALNVINLQLKSKRPWYGMLYTAVV